MIGGEGSGHQVKGCLFNPLRSHNGEGHILIPHGVQQQRIQYHKRQPEDMITVQMGNENGIDGRKPNPVLIHGQHDIRR